MASGFDPSLTKPKALPPVTDGDDLPPPPPSPLRSLGGPPPMPPPKAALDIQRDSSSASLAEGDHFAERPPRIQDALSPPSIRTPPESPSTPSMSTTIPDATSPSASTESDSRPKKVNPFVDLLQSEKMYVDNLSGIIRKVAAAWSRSNLPPPELDMMFRSVEAIYKANRSFQTKLKEIGPNPSSPRAIGDLLMKWIDQLDSPYTKYASSYLSGFDTWEPVQSNQRLPPILEAFSASSPPLHASTWTLDALLSLPSLRLKYYQKLYGRLLKSSAPGKSTDQKLIDGVRRLENLYQMVVERSKIALPGPSQVLETTDEIVIDTRENNGDIRTQDVENDEAARGRDIKDALQLHDRQDVRTSVESSTRGSSLSSGLRSSRDTAMTSEGRASVVTLSMSLADLERRLSTERCQDLFTMTPRSVKLSIDSPNLPYTRELRLSEDTTIYFTPKCNNLEVVHPQGHIFLLTDLFLICERMTSEFQARSGMDMWLCYPPLAAKHIRVAALEDTDMDITILKKETMRLHFDSRTKRDNVLQEFRSTVEFAAALPPPSKQAPPPMPSLGNMSTSLAARRPSDSFSPSRSANASPTASGDPSMHRMDPARNLPNDGNSPHSTSVDQSSNNSESGPPPYSPTDEAPRHSQMASPPGPRPVDPRTFAPGQFVPPPRGESSRGPMSPPGMGPIGLPTRPNMRDGPPSGPPSFAPGQILPQRSDTIRAAPNMGGIPDPRGPISPPPMNGMYGPPRGMMSPPPMNGMQGGLPRSMMSPPPMNGMHGGPPQMGPMVGPPQRNGSMGAPRPIVPGFGPGPSPGAIFTGPNPMHGQQGLGPIPNQFQQLPPHPGQPFANPGRPSSDPTYQGGVRKTPSLHSLSSQYEHYEQPPRSAPPVPNLPNDFLPDRQNSFGSQNHLRPMLPSAALPRIASSGPAFGLDDSPPTSPIDQRPSGPVESVVLATMKCKVFLQQQHAQWKSLGSSKLMLYEQRPTMLKQLVVEADNKDKTLLISTIVLMDGVERVGKTGVAIELSDSGARTGIVYMIQLRNEKSAGGLYDMLLSGSDRGGFRG